MTAHERYTNADGTFDTERAIRDGQRLQAAVAWRMARGTVAGLAAAVSALRAWFAGAGLESRGR